MSDPGGHLSDERIQSYLDAGLPEAERAQIDSHLVGCRECRERLAGYRRLFATIEAFPEIPLGRDLAPAVIRAIARHKRQRLVLRIGIPSAEVVTIAALVLAAWRFVDVGFQALRSTLVGLLAGLSLLPGRILLPSAIEWPQWAGGLRLDLLDIRSASLPGLWTPAALGVGVVVWIAGNWLLLRKQGAGNGHVD